MNTAGFSLVCLFLIGAGSVVGIIQSDTWYLPLSFSILFFATLWFTRHMADQGFFTLCAGALLVVAIGQADLIIAIGIQAVLLGLVFIMTSSNSKGEIRVFLLLGLPLLTLCAVLGVLAGHMTVPLILLMAGCAIAFAYVRLWEYRLSSGFGGNG